LLFTLVGTLVYVGLWHLLFRWIPRLPLLAVPAILTAAFLELVPMTSDGGLQSLPLVAVRLTIVALVAEGVAWYLAGHFPFEVKLQHVRTTLARSRPWPDSG
jgi:hypothetical protein